MRLHLQQQRHDVRPAHRRGKSDWREETDKKV
jgi:hypothetical protein